MPSSKLLKERIESIQDTMKITNAMYLISSSKLRKARKNYQTVSPYFERMQITMTRVLPHLPEEPVHPFFHDPQPGISKPRYMVLTADKGMAGAYNQNVIKIAEEATHTGENENHNKLLCGGSSRLPRIVTPGTRPVAIDFKYTAQTPTLQRARDIADAMTELFVSGELDEVSIIYTKMMNSLNVRPPGHQLLPLERTASAAAPGSEIPTARWRLFPSPDGV